MFIDAILNGQNDLLVSKITKVSLHTADPGLTGANEGSVPRSTPTWPASNGGAAIATVTYPLLSGFYTHLGFWNGTTFIGSREYPIQFIVPATLTIAIRVRHPREVVLA